MNIRLSGFEPQTSVTLDCTATDTNGRTFNGSWQLQTDNRGEASFSDTDVEDDTPESSWYGPERGLQISEPSVGKMLLHHLSPKAIFTSTPNFVVGDSNKIQLTIQVRSGLLGRSLIQDTQSRVYIDPELSRSQVQTERLAGWLYRPSTSGPHPAVITLHGALAATPHRLSELIATHGYATLALQYFDAPGLPASLKEIPVEYFHEAIQWLQNKSGIRDDWIGLVGVSRGVEAALLTATSHDGPATVIGYSGGGVVRHGVTGNPPRAYIEQPAWTQDGAPVAPPEAIDTVFDTVEDIYQHRCRIDPILRSIRSRVSDHILNQVLIPVEEIEGPILLLTGVDDHQWPSTPMSALTIHRLQRQKYSHPYGLRAYCDTGHIFGVPYADYTGEPSSDENGGTPKANAQAAADSWPLVLDYLSPI